MWISVETPLTTRTMKTESGSTKMPSLMSSPAALA